MDEEIWKVYHNGKFVKYEVSNFGRVKKNGEIIDLYINKKNTRYLKFGWFSVHRAVAELFVPNPDNKPCIDHIDTDIYNNRADNLRWVTQAENNKNILTKEKRSKARTGKKYGPYNSHGGMYGKHHSEETKQKLSAALKGRKLPPITEETRQKLKDSHKGQKPSNYGKHKVWDDKEKNIFHYE